LLRIREQDRRRKRLKKEQVRRKGKLDKPRNRKHGERPTNGWDEGKKARIVGGDRSRVSVVPIQKQVGAKR